MRGDTTAAIAALRDVAPNARRSLLDWELEESLPVERLKLAELLQARGEHREALNVASGFDHQGPVIYLPYVAASLALRYRAAVALGWRRAAQGYMERLDSLGRRDLIGG